jgi:hypothetical protein
MAHDDSALIDALRDLRRLDAERRATARNSPERTEVEHRIAASERKLRRIAQTDTPSS